MKKLITLLMLISTYTIAQTNDKSYEELVKESPFNEMYPEFMAQDAAEYFDEFNMLFSEKSPIAAKEARLVAIAVSAAIRCEYCIAAQIESAKKEGANDEEIKAAIQIAAEIQRFSTLLYGNEFDVETFNKLIIEFLLKKYGFKSAGFSLKYMFNGFLKGTKILLPSATTILPPTLCNNICLNAYLVKSIGAKTFTLYIF